MCFNSGIAARLLRCAMLEILMHVQYTPVSALWPPCVQTAHNTFKNTFLIITLLIVWEIQTVIN